MPLRLQKTIIEHNMYNKVECVRLTCDNCGAEYQDDDTGFTIFLTENDAREWAENDGWSLRNKHYCPDCFTIDDNDELIINSKP